MKTIYQSKKPAFTIGRDSFQWILGYGKTESQGKISFNFKTFHPTLSNLLDELAESQFKKSTKTLKDIKELSKSINRVYELIDKVSQTLAKRKF